MSPFPAVFVSHGAPTMAIETSPTHEFLKGLGTELGTPRGVVCASAHWETETPTVTGSVRAETIHDFGGFPDELYALRYPAPGSPELARRVFELAGKAGIEAIVDPSRGLDHGAWVPLSLMYPAADVPVVQLSVQPRRDAAHHFALGAALAPLRAEGILILGSGGATHNLRRLFGHAEKESPAPEAAAFDRWLSDCVVEGREESLLNWRAEAPGARQNHPSPEHFLPLFVPLGAAGSNARGRILHDAFQNGVLSLAAFAWS